MLDKVNDNIAEYQKILDSFNSSVGGTQTLIDNAKSATSALGDAATSGANALSDADSVLKETRTATGDFTSALSQSISNGLSIIEQLLKDSASCLARLLILIRKWEMLWIMPRKSIPETVKLLQHCSSLLHNYRHSPIQSTLLSQNFLSRTRAINSWSAAWLPETMVLATHFPQQPIHLHSWKQSTKQT